MHLAINTGMHVKHINVSNKASKSIAKIQDKMAVLSITELQVFQSTEHLFGSYLAT